MSVFNKNNYDNDNTYDSYANQNNPVCKQFISVTYMLGQCYVTCLVYTCIEHIYSFVSTKEINVK